jgi:hypothetical protein
MTEVLTYNSTNKNDIITVPFTREELVVINNILDLVTKYEGLKIAETTVFLSKKIKDSLSQNQV